MSLKKWIERISSDRRLAISCGILLFAGVTYLDFITGPDVSATVFYLLPVMFFGVFLGIESGITASVIGAGLWFFFDLLSGKDYSHPTLPYWNALLSLFVFLIVSIILLQLQTQLRIERDVNQKLTKANEEILKLSRIKSQFTAMVSHELRTPLATVKESIRLVADGLTGPVTPAQKKYLGVTLRNVERLIRLVNDILDFSKLEEGKRKFDIKFNDLHKVIRETVEFYRPLFERKEIRMEMSFSEEVPVFLFDEDGIAQVLDNVIGNAVKFTEKGSIRIETKKTGDKISLCIQDTGCGIEESEQSVLFQPYEQARIKDRRPDGTGLGLVISKQIVECHGGSIELSSRPGEGTSVRIVLPLNPA